MHETENNEIHSFDLYVLPTFKMLAATCTQNFKNELEENYIDTESSFIILITSLFSTCFTSNYKVKYFVTEYNHFLLITTSKIKNISK